jgi:Na+/melibiose symporter-like transporter
LSGFQFDCEDVANNEGRSVISILRYLLLVQIDWVNQKFPDLKVIQVPALFSVFAIFLSFASTFLIKTLDNQLRQSSPEKSLFIHLIKNKQITPFVMLAIIYSILISISFIMYSLLYYNVRFLKKNSVGILIEDSHVSSDDGKLTTLC